jgi:S1-C subfamily serine protease
MLTALTFMSVVGSVGCAGVPKHLDDAGRAERARDSAVSLVKWGIRGEDGLVEVPRGTRGAKLVAHCSGVWVSQDTFLTAGHCVEDTGEPASDPLARILERLSGFKVHWDPSGQTVHFAMHGDIQVGRVHDNETVRTGRIIGYERTADLALVQHLPENADLALPDHTIVRIASEVRVGEEVDVVGNPLGLEWSYTRGWVSALRPRSLGPRDGRVNAVQISAPVWFGSSGGPALNHEGELVGIASWVQDGPSLGFFVDPSTIRGFLARATH